MRDRDQHFGHIAHAIAQLASRQQGNVTRAQLLAFGLSPGAIKYRITQGLLYPFPAGVYGVGRPARTDLERAAAVVLACGVGALLSHFSALALWDLGPWPAILEVTGPITRNPRGVRTHRSRVLTHRDVRHRQGIALTSPARTLLDCAPHVGDARLTRLVNDARRANRVTRAEIRELIGRAGTHRGVTRLRPHGEAEHAPTASQLEDEFLAFCAMYGIPQPRVNFAGDGRELDAYFVAEKVIVEVDSWKFHGDRESFERDRRKDVEALARGDVTVRITQRRLRAEPAREAERIHAILAARRRGAA